VFAAFSVSNSTPQKDYTFAIGNSKNTVNHEVSDLQMRPNLAHSDSKLCFSNLFHASRPPAIEFLVLSGSWAPEPLQTRFHVYLWGAQSSANTAIHGVCQQTFEKHEVFVNGGSDITVNYKGSGFREAAKRHRTLRKDCKLQCFRRGLLVAPFVASSWPSSWPPSWPRRGPVVARLPKQDFQVSSAAPKEPFLRRSGYVK
jgi:hypothetical protein